MTLWCPSCARRRSFVSAGPRAAAPRERRSRMRCKSCSGQWKFGTDRRGRTTCDEWEPPAALPSENEVSREPEDNDSARRASEVDPDDARVEDAAD